MRRFLIASLLAIVLIGIANYARVSRLESATPGAQITDIESPSDWVPFTAAIEKSGTGSAPVRVGRYFRGADGSTRSEFDLLGGKTNVTIMNVTENMYYEFRKGAWCSHPMRISPLKGWRPKKMREENPNLSKTLNTIDSMPVREVRGPGSIQVVAPELNFFALSMENQATGARTRYVNIVKGPQDASLFLPPPDQPVIAHILPMGIITDGTKPPLPSQIRAEHQQ
jgi:hypothetical protein